MAEGGPPPPPPPASFAGVVNKEFPANNLSFANIKSKQLLSTFKGEPALFLTPEEEDDLSKTFQWTLIGKFSWGRPAMAQIRKEILAVGFKGECKVGLFDQRHIFLKFDIEEDFQRCWTRKVWHFQGFQARIFKWTKDFDPAIEPSVSPVWIRFPHLPLYLYNKEKLFSLASVAGHPLKIDSATAAASDLIRPSEARICVEMDLTKATPHRIWIGSKEQGKWQSIEVEERPAYCSKCCKLGHDQTACDPQKRILKKPAMVALQGKKKTLPPQQASKEWILVSKKGSGNKGEIGENPRSSKGKEIDVSSLPVSCPPFEVPESSKQGKHNEAQAQKDPQQPLTSGESEIEPSDTGKEPPRTTEKATPQSHQSMSHKQQQGVNGITGMTNKGYDQQIILHPLISADSVIQPIDTEKEASQIADKVNVILPQPMKQKHQYGMPAELAPKSNLLSNQFLVLTSLSNEEDPETREISGKLLEKESSLSAQIREDTMTCQMSMAQKDVAICQEGQEQEAPSGDTTRMAGHLFEQEGRQSTQMESFHTAVLICQEVQEQVLKDKVEIRGETQVTESIESDGCMTIQREFSQTDALIVQQIQEKVYCNEILNFITKAAFIDDVQDTAMDGAASEEEYVVSTLEECPGTIGNRAPSQRKESGLTTVGDRKLRPRAQTASGREFRGKVASKGPKKH